MAAGAALAVAGAAAGAPASAFSTSAFTIRPPGPLPVMAERSRPFCSAMRLASGDAFTRAPDDEVSPPEAGAGAGDEAVAAPPPPFAIASSTSPLVILPLGPLPVSEARSIPSASASLRAVGVAAGPSFATAVGVCAGAGGDAGAGALSALGALTSPTSSPSSASMAITAPTETFSVPSSMSIDAITPSSTASNSIVALSVSISAMMSPEETASPTLTSHLAKVPSSIVGDRAGIFNSMAMGRKAFWVFTLRNACTKSLPKTHARRKHLAKIAISSDTKE